MLLERILAGDRGRRGVHGGSARMRRGYRCVGKVLVADVLGFDYVLGRLVLSMLRSRRGSNLMQMRMYRNEQSVG